MAAKKKPAAPAAVMENMSDIERIRVGMIASDWNEAIRLQCAIRDAIKRPVTLLKALQIAREFVILAADHIDLDRFRDDFDDATDRARADSDQQRRDLAAKAGR